MYTSTPTLTVETDTRQRCADCRAPEGSRHPIGNFTVELRTVDIDGHSQTLCSYCGVRAEIRTQRRPVIHRRSIVGRLKKITLI